MKTLEERVKDLEKDNQLLWKTLDLVTDNDMQKVQAIKMLFEKYEHLESHMTELVKG